VKNFPLLLVFVLLGCSSVSFAADQKLTIEGKMIWYFNSSWGFSIEEYGEASGAKFSYKGWYRTKIIEPNKSYSKRKTVERKTTLSKGQIELIEAAVKAETFFTISERLRDSVYVFHQPDYRLKICFDKNCHRVSLYDPSRIPLKMKADAEKFKAVWSLLWSFAKNPEVQQPDMGFKYLGSTDKNL